MEPDNRLFCNATTRRSTNDPHSVGTRPSNWLSYRYNASNIVNLPTEAGRFPDNEFSFIAMYDRLFNFPISCGNDPVKEQLYADSSRRSASEVKDEGSDPYNHGLLPTLRTTKDLRLPISSGRVPFSWFPPAIQKKRNYEMKATDHERIDRPTRNNERTKNWKADPFE